jgi:hypothetical protein
MWRFVPSKKHITIPVAATAISGAVGATPARIKARAEPPANAIVGEATVLPSVKRIGTIVFTVGSASVTVFAAVAAAVPTTIGAVGVTENGVPLAVKNATDSVNWVSSIED